MPAKRKNELVQCQYFQWRLFRRDGVWYADGRFGDTNLRKHSLGTRDLSEAKSALRNLDHVMAIEMGLAKDTGSNFDSPLSIERGWALYLASRDRPEVMGGVSHKTMNKYRRSSVLHQAFCGEFDIRYWNDFGKVELESYGRKLDRRYSARSLYFELMQVKTVINWLIEEKHLPQECGFRLRLSKPEGNETYCYTPDQVVAMLELCNSVQALHWLGNIIRVLACTGLRIGELVHLRRSDIDFENDLIRLTDERSSQRRKQMGTARRTKGRRDRTLPLHPDIKSLLQDLPIQKHGRALHGPQGGKINVDRTREKFVRSVINPLSEQFTTPNGDGVLPIF